MSFKGFDPRADLCWVTVSECHVIVFPNFVCSVCIVNCENERVVRIVSGVMRVVYLIILNGNHIFDRQYLSRCQKQKAISKYVWVPIKMLIVTIWRSLTVPNNLSAMKVQFILFLTTVKRT